MALSYDFDMFDVIPSTDGDDPDLRRFLTDAGFDRGRHAAQKVALFRDWCTADALRNAPPPLQEYFLSSGFGLNTFQSGAPAGRYPEADEEARLRIIERLTENAPRFALHMATGEGAFSLSDFLRHLAEAQPLAMPRSLHAVDATSEPVPKNRDRGAIAGITLSAGMLAGMTTRLLKGMPRLGQMRRG